jgi:hypothetical protein
VAGRLNQQITAGWICRHPDRLAERDTARLRALLDRCPELAAAADLVRSFADVLTNLHGEWLGAWITAAGQAALPGLMGFATGLTSDLDAVTAGLTRPHSSGPVEGKRQPENDQASDVRPSQLRSSPKESCWLRNRRSITLRGTEPERLWISRAALKRCSGDGRVALERLVSTRSTSWVIVSR